MARSSKLEVAAINIRIAEDRDRDYVSLINALAHLRQGIRVYGDTYLAISFFDVDSRIGVFSKYTEIDIDGDWFDLEDFDSATPDKLEEINIPENLRPNHAAFYFQLDSDLHVVAFSTYASSKGLSARSVGQYFNEALSHSNIQERFGVVESDIVKNYDEVDRILALPHLKELQICISRPNSDDIGESLADIIERRLREQNADVYEESLRARGRNDITPSERTQNLAKVAAENGNVRAKALINGILTTQNTDEQPLIERDTYKAEERREMSVFQELAHRIFAHIAEARAALR
ncbi:MAG TPA: DUF4747 family protein [Sphingobium sp.]|nr:DUF4747 family protein [Sphingobium sp.]